MQKQISVPVIIGIVVALVLVIGFAAYRLAPQPRSVLRSSTAGMPGGGPPPSAFKPIDQVRPVPRISVTH